MKLIWKQKTVSQTFFHGPTPKTIFRIQMNPDRLKRKQNRQGSWQHTDFAPILPIAGQKKFPRYVLIDTCNSSRYLKKN
jgi:hypothetical protein